MDKRISSKLCYHLNVCYSYESTFVSVFTIRRTKGTSAVRACGVLMVKILIKCLLSILVY